MFKNYSNPISKGEEKHKTEVELCKMADHVVGVGPKLSEAFRSYLRSCRKDDTVLDFTPGVFEEFAALKQVPSERQQRSVLVFGRGDVEDFELKGFDIAGKAISALEDTRLVFVGAPDGKHEEIAKRLTECGVPARRLRVRGFVKERESLKDLFQEVDLVIMPSRTEGFGLTGLEALSAGLSVLVSSNSGFGEALCCVPFGSTYVVNSDEPMDWTSAIKKIWAKDRKSRLEEAKMLRDSFDKNYNWAKQIKDLTEKMISWVHDLSFPNDIFERIRQLYRTREQRLLPVPWCEDFSFHLNDIFTRLKISGKEKTRGVLTDEIPNMTAIFKAHKECLSPRTILIEGDPGMGKTTYCQKLAYDWATKKDKWDPSFPEIEVLLLLKCNEIQSNIWEAIDDQILPEEMEDQSKEWFFKFIRENQSEVLLVLDGLDEVDPSNLKLLSSLIQGKELSRCYIVVTSRHEAGSTVRRYFDTLWEIEGFTKTDATSFILKYFENINKEHLAWKLIERIWPWYHFSFRSEPQQDRDLSELTKNPLNTALLCVIYEDFEGVFPASRTELYTEIVLCVLRRYEQKQGLSSKNEDLMTVYKNELIDLGRMALESLLKGELYFEEHKSDGGLIVLSKFGFLSLQAGGSKRKVVVRYTFLHNSFQEFFSGFYLAYKLIEGEIECQSVVTDQRYENELYQVFLFMIGILVSTSEKTAQSLVTYMARNITSLQSARDISKRFAFCLGCLSKHETLVCTLGEHLLISYLKLEPPISNEVVSLSKVLSVNSSLTHLDLSKNSIGDSEAASLSQALAVNSSLTNLDLSRNSIGDSGAASLSQALAANSSLTNLNLSTKSIDFSGAASLSLALAVNSSLTNLDLSTNSIGFSGAASLSQALAVNSSLTNLYLSRNFIGDSGAASLSQALEVNSSLTNLNLSRNFIDDSGAWSLSRALAVNSSLTNLDLSINIIGFSGAESLSQALAVNSSLTNLDLSRNSIGDSGAASLSQALAVNSSLTNLDLSRNSIGGSGAASLSQGLAVNSSLTHLDLSGNSIGDSGGASLSQGLAVNSSLTNLDLSWNSIGGSGAASLSQGLAVNSSLTHLDLSRNSIGDSGASSLSQALAVTSSLTYLNLRDNSMGDSGATALSHVSTVNTTVLLGDLL
ncbi:unnamed protein product, partial [Porites lobata]